MLLSFSDTNQLVVTMNRTLTNIFPLPFGAGPANCTSAVFTALHVPHQMNIATAVSSWSIPSEEIDQEINVDDITR